MQGLTGRLPDIRTTIRSILEACKLASESSSALAETDTNLPSLEQAFEQLLDIMTRIESDAQAAPGKSTKRAL